MILMTENDVNDLVEKSCGICKHCGLVQEEVDQTCLTSCPTCVRDSVIPMQILIDKGEITLLSRVIDHPEMNKTQRKIEELREKWEAKPKRKEQED